MDQDFDLPRRTDSQSSVDEGLDAFHLADICATEDGSRADLIVNFVDYVLRTLPAAFRDVVYDDVGSSFGYEDGNA